MAEILPFERPKPSDEDKPHIQGEVVCGACEHVFRGVAPVGDKHTVRDGGCLSLSFECPKCHAKKGIFSEFVQYEKAPTWHCECCRGWLFSVILAKDVPCIVCANCGQMRNAIDLFND